MGKNIGFISTRFAGTDGVTLESIKWADILAQKGHRCYWFAGQSDREAKISFVVPEAHFKDEANQWINAQIFDTRTRNPLVTRAIHQLRSTLKTRIYEFIQHFKLDLLIAENVLCIPMHVPLGLALTEAIAETQIPTIAHHHDFYWERTRFSANAVSDYLHMAFPPTLTNIKHVVINSEAQEQLAHRTGISATVIPNVLDFETAPAVNGRKARSFRESVGLAADDLMILQPTRVIQRKGIEHAVELIRQLKDARCKLVVSHEAGDEGFEYLEWLKEYAAGNQVDLRLAKTRMTDPWQDNGGSPRDYTLWDVYRSADFVTFPSLYEGFGNAFLEAIYFKKPLLVNRYATFIRDIEPLGFDLVAMDGFLSRKNVLQVKTLLDSPERRREMVNRNYDIARRHYSCSVLRAQLSYLMSDTPGDSREQLKRNGSDPRKIVYLKSPPASVRAVM